MSLTAFTITILRQRKDTAWELFRHFSYSSFNITMEHQIRELVRKLEVTSGRPLSEASLGQTPFLQKGSNVTTQTKNETVVKVERKMHR